MSGGKCAIFTFSNHVWLPKISYALIPLTFLHKLSYGPGMRTIALPVLCTLLGLFQNRALLHLEILARISHQAAQDTDKTLALWSKAWIVKNTACYSSMPITVQAGLRVRKLALHSNRSYGYAFRSRAALTNTNPAPAPVILVRNAG